MILRNPASLRDSFFFFFLLSVFLFIFHAPLSAQGIQGKVTEEISHQPVANTAIKILQGDSVIASLLTDSLGQYYFASIEPVRIYITINAIGFRPYVSEELMLDGYTLYNVESKLILSPYELAPVTITSSHRNTNIYSSQVTKEDLLLVAGNFDDPVRVAHSQPGIIMLNDQANYFSSRGQPPILNSWYLEGCEIVNPNHTNNAGMPGDLPTQYGGGVNMFSAQTLGSTDMYIGLNPVQIGRSAGAVIDMHLHETAKPEFRAKAGLLGFEFGGGLKTGDVGILDVNLRYSFTGLLTDLGADFGGEKIGFYDGVLSYRLQGEKYKLKFFGFGGKSKNDFEKLTPDEERERFKDFFDIHYDNDIKGAGLRLDMSISKTATLSARGAYSVLESGYTRNGIFDSTAIAFDRHYRTRVLSAITELNWQAGPKWSNVIGVELLDRTFRNGLQLYEPLQDELFYRPYVNLEIALSKTIVLEAGGEFKYIIETGVGSTGQLGYRGVLNYKLSPKHLFYLGYRKGGGFSVELATELEERAADELDNSKLEMGLKWFGTKHQFELKVYDEKVTYMTVYPLTNGYLHLADYLEPDANDWIISNDLYRGSALYSGIEGQWKMILPNSIRININQSVFESRRRIEEGAFTGGRFDTKYASHISFAKEIIRQKNEKNRIWNFSARFILQGGLKEPSIDEMASEEKLATVYVNPYEFDNRLPAYKRIDIGIYRTIATSKIKWRYALDIQNVLGMKNIAYHYYDPFLREVKEQEHLGIIPVLSIQASW